LDPIPNPQSPIPNKVLLIAIINKQLYIISNKMKVKKLVKIKYKLLFYLNLN